MTGPALRQMLCPVALHPDGSPLRLPAIVCDGAGMGLVHCAEGSGETRAQTAAYALYHLTGLQTRDALLIGHDEGQIDQGALWRFYLCRITPPVRDTWQHLTPDGVLNKLCWIDLSAPQTFASPIDRLVCNWIERAL